MKSRFWFLTAGGVHVSAGLLVLRVLGAGSILYKHGFEKVLNFGQMSQHFPDPIHIGVTPSLVVAMLADFVCSILIMLGFATRWAALFSLANIFVAWALVHHFAYQGKGNGSDHGELIVAYMVILLSIALAGPGRYSVDARLTSDAAAL